MGSEAVDKTAGGRGRPPKEEYSKEVLKAKLRQIVPNHNGMLNFSELERLTGIKRRNWIKVEDTIATLNKVPLGIDPEAIKEFVLPSIKEAFDLYYGKDKKKLMGIFQDYNELIAVQWGKSTSFDRLEQEHNETLAEKDREIERLITELKNAKEDAEFHKRLYEQIGADSAYASTRREMNLKKNVSEVKKGDKKILDMDFAKKFEGIFEKKK